MGIVILFITIPLWVFIAGECIMCRAVTCRTCGKTTWAGCGQHVAAVKASVRASEWCNGKHTPAQVDAARASKGGFLTKLFGR